MNEKVIKAVASLRAFFPTFTKAQTAAYSQILSEYPPEVVLVAIKVTGVNRRLKYGK